MIDYLLSRCPSFADGPVAAALTLAILALLATSPLLAVGGWLLEHA
ncbi:MAG: hypothetical protein RLW62_09805 [Gammaproteobacteria bacterium]